MIIAIINHYQHDHGRKNIEKHTAHTIPNPKQWVIVHTSDLMIIRQRIYIISIISKGMGKLETHSRDNAGDHKKSFRVNL